MNETVLTQDDWLVVANNLSLWINDSEFLDITADFTKSGTSIFVLRFNDANHASALTLGMTVSLAEAIALANEFLKEEKNWPRDPATSGRQSMTTTAARKEVSSVAYDWKYEIKGWGAVFNEGNLAEDTREDTLARRDKLVMLLRESDWYAEQPEGEDSALAQRVRELAAADDEFEMQNLIIAIYDLADIERAWLDPGLEWA